MQKFSVLYQQIFDFETLLRAHKRCSRGKRGEIEVQRFEAHREEEIITLQNELIWESYLPSPTRTKVIIDPKKRYIQVPAYRDRVLQQAAHIVLNPVFERRMIYDSYACRVGKGTHRAVGRAQKFLRDTAKGGRVFFLKCDISHFYASINHTILKQLITRVIHDKDVLALLEAIIDSYEDAPDTGLPLGAVLSQMFANIYLDALDHLIKDGYGWTGYLRYMDDFVLFGNNKSDLSLMRTIIERWLHVRLKLTFNKKTRIVTGSEGCDFCGYRIWTTHILPRKRNIRKIRKRLRKMAKMCIAAPSRAIAITQVWASFKGYMKHCSSRNTMKSIQTEINKILQTKEAMSR